MTYIQRAGDDLNDVELEVERAKLCNDAACSRPLVMLQTRLWVFFSICSAATLSLHCSQGHKLHYYVKFMQKSVALPVRNLLLCVCECMCAGERRAVRERVMKSFHFGTFTLESKVIFPFFPPHNQPLRINL